MSTELIPLDFTILEESRVIKYYTWTCGRCSLKLHHAHRKTLEHNIEQHVEQQHSEKAVELEKIRDLKKEVSQIRKQVNRRYGI